MPEADKVVDGSTTKEACLASRKELLARVLHATRADVALLAWQRRCWSPFIRVINYHDVPPTLAGAFERQLLFYREKFEPVDLPRLRRLLTGQWEFQRPGLVLSFDDGLRSHAEIVAPLLERYGFTGWFLVPGGFIDAEPGAQAEFARAHLIRHSHFDYGDPRLAMTWDQVRELSWRHVIGCHSWNHRRLGNGLTRADLESEIPKARQRLAQELGSAVEVFAWVGGEEWSYSREAASVIREAGYVYSLMTNNEVIRPGCDPFQLQRTNIEAADSDAVVRFQLSGLMDLLYVGKRKRVNRLTAGV